MSGILVGRRVLNSFARVRVSGAANEVVFRAFSSGKTSDFEVAARRSAGSFYGGRGSGSFYGGRGSAGVRDLIPQPLNIRFLEYSSRPNTKEGPNGKKFVRENLRKLLEACKKLLEACKKFLEAFKKLLIQSRVRAVELHEMYYPSVVVGIISSAIWTAFQTFIAIWVLGKGDEANQIKAEVKSVMTFLEKDKAEKLEVDARKKAEKMKEKLEKEERKRVAKEKKKEEERLARERERSWFKW